MAWASRALPRTNSPLAEAARPGRLWRVLKQRLFERYRPERHYMRGPGPKCREKQQRRQDRAA